MLAKVFTARPLGFGRAALVVACCGCVALGALVSIGVEVAAWLPWLAILTLVVVIGVGVFWQRSGVFAHPLLSVKTGRAEVALTFDDGPCGEHTLIILSLLEARGHRATFFVVGATAARDPQLLAEISRRGHAVENHSWFHSYFTPFANPSSLAAELMRTSALIESACARRPRWFRPPVGILSPRIAAAAALAGLELVGWSGTARDGVPSRSEEVALARLERAVRPGAILVLHDGVVQGTRVPIAVTVLPRCCRAAWLMAA